MAIPYATVGDLVSSLRAIGDHTRPPFDIEILSALNFGYKECVRAISSVRSEYFSARVSSFTLPANAREIDISGIDPPLWRPTRLLVPNAGGRNTPILFRYRALHSQEHEAAELSPRSGVYTWLLYDVLSGNIPSSTTTVFATSPPGGPVQVADATQFPPGTYVSMPVPAPTPMTGGVPMVSAPPGISPYYGFVATRSGAGPLALLTFHPAIPSFATIPATTVLTKILRMALRIANPLTTDQTGELWYQYRPPILVNYDQVLDPIVAEHRDLVIYYALSQYLSAVNDTESSAWLQKAQLLKSELMQDLEPLSGQNSESLDSALWGLD